MKEEQVVPGLGFWFLRSTLSFFSIAFISSFHPLCCVAKFWIYCLSIFEQDNTTATAGQVQTTTICMKLFCTKSHVWLKSVAPSRYLIGLSNIGLEEVGSVKKYQVHSSTDVQKGDTLLTFDWEGYKRTEADELYHAVWDSTSGSYQFKSPLAGAVVDYNHKELHCPVEEDWLVEINIEQEEKDTVFWNSLVSADTYDQIDHPRGLFHEQEL